jgi:hypothetical protein
MFFMKLRRIIMTNNEKELLNIIRNHGDTEEALNIAINIIIEFLAQDESSQEQPVACSREFA